MIATLRVGERDDDVDEDPKGNIAPFAIVFARVLDGDQRTIKDYRGVVKIDAVFGEIELSLLFIPREHKCSVATLCRYVKTGTAGRSCRLTSKVTGDHGAGEAPPVGVRVDRRVSVVIGPVPQIAPKKHWVPALWQGGMWRRGRPM